MESLGAAASPLAGPGLNPNSRQLKNGKRFKGTVAHHNPHVAHTRKEHVVKNQEHMENERSVESSSQDQTNMSKKK